MGTTLTGTTPQDTYDSLIKVTDNGPLSGTAKYLSDGLGNDSALALSTGNIGIGTTSPSRNLHILGGAGIGTVLKLEAGSGAITYLQLAYNGATNAQSGYISYDSSANMGLFTNDNEKVRITSTGNVGIGTSSPSYKLDVSGISSSNTGFLISSGQYDNIGQTPYTGMFMTGSSSTDGFGALLLTSRTDLARPIIFGTSNGSISVERVRIDANGLKFNGDTAAANALDDYEEGTWTPVITDGTNDATMIAGNGGTYTKIGRQVTVNAYCRTTSLGSVSGNIFIKGLPFTSSSSLEAVSSSTFGYLEGMALGTAGYSVGGFVNTSATRITLTLNDSTSGTSSMQASEWSNTGYAHITITYFV